MNAYVKCFTVQLFTFFKIVQEKIVLFVALFVAQTHVDLISYAHFDCTNKNPPRRTKKEDIKQCVELQFIYVFLSLHLHSNTIANFIFCT